MNQTFHEMNKKRFNLPSGRYFRNGNTISATAQNSTNKPNGLRMMAQCQGST